LVGEDWGEKRHVSLTGMASSGTWNDKVELWPIEGKLAFSLREERQNWKGERDPLPQQTAAANSARGGWVTRAIAISTAPGNRKEGRGVDTYPMKDEAPSQNWKLGTRKVKKYCLVLLPFSRTLDIRKGTDFLFSRFFTGRGRGPSL